MNLLIGKERDHLIEEVVVIVVKLFNFLKGIVVIKEIHYLTILINVHVKSEVTVVIKMEIRMMLCTRLRELVN